MSKEPIFVDKAIPLITVKDSKFSINQQALDILSAVEKPITVLGVAGLYRTGKSFLLNRIILNKEKGFGVGSTINACTKGIWMWGKPIPTVLKDKRKVNMIVIDSEGLGAIDQGASHDCRIFALVLLLSSIFVYNSVGAIDENAISNLSLVVNLTKHIEVNSRKGGNSEEETDDSNEFHQIFPSFCWVLRDFALQLVDEYGRDISSKEYLENALQMHKGITDEIDQKNRIRRLIKEFFRDRDCFTLVRPLTEENELQSLERRPFSEMRQEFVSQSYELREMLFTQDKIKKIKGKEISGEILAGLLSSYVETINTGNVPNIENAWTYICKSQNIKLTRSFENEFIERMTSQIKDNIPLSEKHIQDVYKELKESLLKEYVNSSIGDEKEGYIAMLKEKFKKIRNDLLEENDREFETILYNEMSDQYSSMIGSKLQAHQYQSVAEYVKDFTAFNDCFLGSNFSGPLKLERVYKFSFNRMLDSVEDFSESWKKEWENKFHEKDKALIEMTNKRNAIDKEMKRQDKTMQKNLEEKEEKLYELGIKLKDLEEQNKNYKQKIEENERYFNGQFLKEKEKEKQRYVSLEEKYNELVKKQKDQESQFNAKEAEFGTQLALMKDKLAHYETCDNEINTIRTKMLNRQKKVEEDYKSKMNKQREEFEIKIKDLKTTVNELKEKNNVFEDEINKKYILNESMQQDFNKKENEFRSFISQNDDIINKLKIQLEEVSKNKRMDSTKEESYTNEIKGLKRELEEASNSLKISENKLQLLNINLDKEKTLVKQNKEFYEIRLNEMQAEIDELKKVKDKTLNSFQTDNVSKAELLKQIQECKNMYEANITRINEEHEAERAEYQEKYYSLVESEEANAQEHRKYKEKMNQQYKELKNALSIVEIEKSKLIERVKTIEENKEKAKHELEILYNKKISELEKEIEEISEEKETEVQRIKSDMEERLKRLRALYEEDRTNFDSKIMEEKAKLEKMIKSQKEEIDQYWKTEVNNKEDEIEMLKLEIEEMQGRMSSFEQEVEDEMQIYINKLEESENIIKEKESEFAEVLRNEQVKHGETMKIKEEEIVELKTRLEDFKDRLQEKEVLLYQIKQQLENNKDTSERELSGLKKQLSECLQNNEDQQNKIELLKEEKTKINKELIETTVNFSKDLALSKQKLEFNKKKIAELQSIIENNELNADQHLSKLKEELENEIALLKATLKEKEEDYMKSMDNKKKALKDAETKLNLKIYELQKSNQIIADKLKFTESKKNEIEEQLNEELIKNKTAYKKLQESLMAEKTTLMEEISTLKKENLELGIQVAETNAKYDKDKAVFEGKLNFFDQQNKKLKSELHENQRNFDMMFHKLHQYRQTDKQDLESSHNAYINSLEQRNISKIADLKEKHKETVTFLKEKIKNLEKETKQLRAKKQEILDDRYNSGIVHESRLNELLEKEKDLQQEIFDLKAEKDNLSLFFQKELDKQKEIIKKKLNACESKYKRSEEEKNQLLYEQEKLKTKWQIEKNHIISQKNENADMLDRLNKQKQILQKENDKLRMDLKNLRKSNLVSSTTNFSKKRLTQFFSGNRYKNNDSVSIITVSNNDNDSGNKNK